MAVPYAVLPGTISYIALSLFLARHLSFQCLQGTLYKEIPGADEGQLTHFNGEANNLKCQN